jgi:hypothetical protein
MWDVEKVRGGCSPRPFSTLYSLHHLLPSQLCLDEAPPGYAWSDLRRFLQSKGLRLAH